MGERGRVIEAKVNECTKQLNEIKAAMKKQTGIAYKNSQQKAFMVLKRRKMYETQLNGMMNQQFNVDQVQFTSETIQTTIDTAAGMRQAAAAQKEAMKKIDINQLEDLHEDMADMMEDQEEIQEVLGRDYAVDAVNEEELNEELGELDEEIVNEKLEGGKCPSYVPQAAAAPPVKADKEELNNIMNN